MVDVGHFVARHAVDHVERAAVAVDGVDAPDADLQLLPRLSIRLS